MNENLDLTKILEGCPTGTKFYSTIFGNVSFEEIDLDCEYPIIMSQGIITMPITKEGIYALDYDGKCTLFPDKNQRDWSKFERFWDKPNVEKFDLKTLKPFDKVLVRNHSTNIWQPNFFGYINDENPKTISCFGFYWDYCIPYNEETKHLVGTSDDCPEYYKWWEEQL